MSDDDSYQETLTNLDDASDSMSILDAVIPEEMKAPKRGKSSSKIYYRDEFTQEGWTFSLPFDVKDMVVPKVHSGKLERTLSLGGKEYEVLDIHRDQVLQRAAQSKFLRPDGVKEIERKIVELFDKKGWDYAVVSNNEIQAVLDEYGVVLPLSTPAEQVDERIEQEWNAELEIARLMSTNKLTIAEVAERAGVLPAKVLEVYKYVKEHKCLPSEKRSKKKTMRNGNMPTYAQVKGVLKLAYSQKGHVAKGWRGFVELLQVHFPHLKTLSPKTIANHGRVHYKLRAMKAGRKPYGKTVQEVNELELAQAGIELKILSEEDILYYDQTTYKFEATDLQFIGDSEFRPRFSLGRPKAPLHMLCAYLPSGPYALQFSDQSATSDQATYFLASVCTRYRQERKVAGCFVYLDNAPYQKTVNFKKIMKGVGAVLIYGIPNSPFLNLVEDFFLAIKRRIKQGNPLSHAAHLQLIAPSIVDASKSCDWILKKFLDKVLLLLQTYRSSGRDASVPSGIDKIIQRVKSRKKAHPTK